MYKVKSIKFRANCDLICKSLIQNMLKIYFASILETDLSHYCYLYYNNVTIQTILIRSIGYPNEVLSRPPQAVGDNRHPVVKLCQHGEQDPLPCDTIGAPRPPYHQRIAPPSRIMRSAAVKWKTMNRFWAYTSVLTFAVLLPMIWLMVWRMTPQTVPSPAHPPANALPQPRLPQVPLPEGITPARVALRRAIHNGERVYQSLCYNCHGRWGKGDNNDYMESIGHKPADHTDLGAMQKLSDRDFFIALRDGVKDERGWFTMPPWASVLSEQDMWDVITYVRHLPAAPDP